MRLQKAWTLNEIKFMTLMYPTETSKVIAQEIGRTHRAVRKAMSRYGIKKFDL